MSSYHKIKKRYIITGGSGFIGTNFIEYLITNKKNIKIINIDKISYASNKLLLKKNNVMLKNIKANLNDKEKLKRIINIFKPNKIIHFAAESHVDRSIETPFKFAKENISSTLNLLTCSLNFYNQIKKKFKFELVYIGTDEIYGDLGNFSKKKFTDKSNISPNNPYSASKASCFHFVNSFHKTYGLPVRKINFCNNFGKFQFPEKLIPKTILCIIKNKPVQVYGNGLQIRNWLYVEDTVKKIFKIINSKKNKIVFNLSSNLELTNLNLINMIHKEVQKKINKQIPLKLNFVKDRPGHDLRYSLKDNTPGKTINYNKISFSLRLAKVVGWYLDENNLKYFFKISDIYKRKGLIK